MSRIILSLSALLTACAGGDLVVPVDATVEGQSARCGDPITLGGTTGTIADLKWFVSEPRALVDGEEVALSLVPDETWQAEDIALIDLEDATADCAAMGSPATNDQLVFDAASARTLRSADALVFTLGVPFDRNHRDPAAEPAPMNDPTTFWVWQSGYKFLRLDLTLQGDGVPPAYNVHLGSTGCTSDGATVAPSVECSRPNRARIEVPWDGEGTGLTLALDALLAEVDLTVNAPDSPPGCMANPKDVGDCEPVFEAVGMDFATGACVDDCLDQVAFRAETGS